jgi:hypothetical protein
MHTQKRTVFTQLNQSRFKIVLLAGFTSAEANFENFPGAYLYFQYTSNFPSPDI